MKSMLIVLLLASPVYAGSWDCWNRLSHGMDREEVYQECGSPAYRQEGQAIQLGPNIFREETWIYSYPDEDKSIVIQFDFNGEVKRIRER